MYRVLARKWRPLGFADLVGQRHVAVTLTNALRAGRVAHAYLFAGVRGTGKTTVARILARCLNCVRGPTSEPCNACEACREIAESRAIDVLEIDAASRTKVDQTREMLEVVSYAPVRDRNRVLIIDEAHMLSKGSFNALLKTLEEPPPNVVFVLATTELQRIPATILSRCQVFEFRRVPPREMLEHLRKVAEGEGLRISDASLERVARAGEGSVRDALSVLERVIAYSGNEIPDADVLQILGAVGPEVLLEWVGRLAARDAGGMLAVLDSVAEAGHDLQHFRAELLGALRDLLLARSLGDASALVSRPVEEAAALERAAAPLSLEDLVRAFQMVADLEPALRASAQPRFLFEACLVRLAALAHVRPIEELLQDLGAAPSTTGPEKDVKKKSAEPSARSAPPAGESPRATFDRAAPRGVAGSVAPAPRPAPERSAAKTPPPSAGFLEALGEIKPMLAAMLEHAVSIDTGEGELTVRFDRAQEHLARTLEARATLAALEAQASAWAGHPLRVRIELRQAGETAVAEPAPVPAVGPAQRDELLRAARSDPGVQTLLREFGAQVLDIQPCEPAGAAAEPGSEEPLGEEAR